MSSEESLWQARPFASFATSGHLILSLYYLFLSDVVWCILNAWLPLDAVPTAYYLQPGDGGTGGLVPPHWPHFSVSVAMSASSMAPAALSHTAGYMVYGSWSMMSGR